MPPIKSTTFVLLALPCISIAQIVIDDISGAPLDGQTVTVNGSGFGAQGPSVHLYDNFDDTVSVGDTVDTTPVIGPDYYEYGGNMPTHDDISYSGDFSMRVFNGDDASPVDGRNGFAQVKTEFSPVTEIFLSYWLQIPSGHTFPGSNLQNNMPTTGTISSINWSTWKLVWMFDGDDDVDDNDIVLPTSVNGAFFVLGNNTRQVGDSIRMVSASEAVPQPNSLFRWGEWIRFTVWLRANPGDLKGAADSRFTYEVPTSDIFEIRTSDTEPVFYDDLPAPAGGDQPPYQWTHMNFTGFTGGGVADPGWELTRPLFDEVYLATGTGAQARIEICDGATYAACEKFGYIIPSSWGSSSIDGVIYKGGLSDIELGSSFIYVYDTEGNVNANGFPLCAACPLPPSNFQVE